MDHEGRGIRIEINTHDPMNRTFPIALLSWHALVLINPLHIYVYDAWGFAMQRNKCTSLTHVSYVAIYVKLEKTCARVKIWNLYFYVHDDDKSKAFIRIDLSCPLPFCMLRPNLLLDCYAHFFLVYAIHIIMANNLYSNFSFEVLNFCIIILSFEKYGSSHNNIYLKNM